MIRHFCTITTTSHYHKTIALFESLLQLEQDIRMHVLVVNAQNDHFPDYHSKIEWSGLETVRDEEYAQGIIEAYPPDSDALRWSLKSVWMKALLGRFGIEKLFYCDNDLFFHSDFNFLYDELDKHRFLLSPHFRSMDPYTDPDNFQNQFTDGIFNGGFVGASNAATEILVWWAKACLFRCEKAKSEGFFVDQKYLDALPARFEGVGIIRHMGCNVAWWNKVDAQRNWKEGKILINNRWPIIFIHYTSNLIEDIRAGGDPLLADHLLHYEKEVQKVSQWLAVQGFQAGAL